jgi:hypothetical protein
VMRELGVGVDSFVGGDQAGQFAVDQGGKVLREDGHRGEGEERQGEGFHGFPSICGSPDDLAGEHWIEVAASGNSSARGVPPSPPFYAKLVVFNGTTVACRIYLTALDLAAKH